MERLNFNHFYYFYIIAMEGSIRAASEKLFISQPTISDQLKLLEEYFNCKLFERKNRALFLTAQGDIALKYAQEVFDAGREVTSILRNNLAVQRNSIEVGISRSMSQYFLYEDILKLMKKENLTINFNEDQRHLCLAKLEEGELDVVFTDNKSNISSTMSAYRIGLNKTFVVAHKSYKKYKKGFPESLSEIPFFNYSSKTSLRFEIELFFSKHGISPRVIGEGDDIDLFEAVTENALGFTVVPEIAKNRICLNKDIIVLGEIDDFESSVWAIIKKSYDGILRDFLKKNKK